MSGAWDRAVESSEETIIKLSKFKITLLVTGSIVFVLGGIWLLTLDPQQIESARRFNNPALITAVAYASIVFFGLCGIYGAIKLFDTKPGLVLNSSGITDYSSAVAAGLIPWQEIRGFREFQVSGQKMLVVLVNDPERYVNMGNPIRRALNKANFNMVGSPISISANALKISYAELTELCLQFHRRYVAND